MSGIEKARAEGKLNERHSKLGMLGRRGPWTTLSIAVGGETTPSWPSKGGRTGGRRRGVIEGKRGERHHGQ